MRLRRFLACVALLFATLLAACGPTIRDLNLRPEKHYQEKLSVKGRILRMQEVGSDTLLEISDTRDSRLLVRSSRPVSSAVGDWVTVTGVLVPEARVGDSVLYDVLTAEDVSGARAPWFPNLM